MPSGYTVLVGGVKIDLDDWFDPYVQGAKPALTGYTVAGFGDLRDRYAPLAYGIKAALTNYNVTGVGDLRELFAAKGSARYTLPADGMTAIANEVLNNGQSGYAVAQFIVNADGTYKFYTVRSPNPSVDDTIVISQGMWNTLGGNPAADYKVRFTLSNIQYPDGTSAGATTSNTASGFTVVGTGQSVRVRADGAFASGSRSIAADLKIELARVSDGSVFSTTNVHLEAHIDGSV